MLSLVQRLSLSVQARTASLRHFPEPPRVRFAADQNRCEVCGQPLKSYKTTEARTVVSWTYGTLRVVEQLRYCPAHRGTAGDNEDTGLSRSQQLSTLVPPRHRYAYDLVAHVGRRSFLDCRNERELLEELEAAPAGLSIPRRSLERLREEFLWYVAAVHAQATPTLRQLFAHNGGYVLCVDGTCETGSPVHLVCQDAVTGIVLSAFKIGSENKVETRRCLERVQERFGDPVATMADLRNELRTVREALWPEVVHFFCHYHFVQNVGTKLLKPLHDRLGALLQQAQLSAALIERRRYLGKRLRDCVDEHPLQLDEWLRHTRQQDEAPSLNGKVLACLSSKQREQLEREQLTKLILWIQAAPSDSSGQAFPFALPKLDTYRRCQQALLRLEEWLRQPAPGSRQRRHFETVRDLLSPLVHGDEFEQTVQDLEHTQADFLRLREVLRVDPANGVGHRIAEADFLAPDDAQRCQEDAENFRQELRQRLQTDAPATDVKVRSAQLLLQQLDKYWNGLFGHALVTDNGGLLLVTRTNNQEEATHRFGKRCQRRLHGRASLKRDLQRWPAERALLHNLTNTLYVERVYGTLDNLPHKFADAFPLLAEVRADSQSDPATVRLTPSQRKGTQMLENITRVRQLTAPPTT